MKKTSGKRQIASADLIPLWRVEEAQRRLVALALANEKLEKEIRRRYVVEVALKQSERHQKLLLKQAVLMQTQLRDLSRGVIGAQEDERRRISRELHDQVLQSLIGINVYLETVCHKTVHSNAKELKVKIVHAQKLVADAAIVIHRFARELRPFVLDDLGLLPALRSAIAEFSKRTGIHVEFTAHGELQQLNNAQRTVLYRVVQSALANIVKHAAAKQVEIYIQQTGETILLEIHDNGRSFDVARTLNARSYKRLGLLGMRERVEMVGGSFHISSAPRDGTTVRVELPLETKIKRKSVLK